MESLAGNRVGVMVRVSMILFKVQKTVNAKRQ